MRMSHAGWMMSLGCILGCGGASPAPAPPPLPASAVATPTPVAEPAANVERPAPPPAAPPEPKPTPEQIKTVEAFAGDWTYEATITLPQGKTVKAPIGLACKKIAAGKGAACSMAGDFPGV